jgi:hypothetical protein
MTNDDLNRGPAGPAGVRGARGETGAAGERGPAGETAHVENATIDVSEATIIQSPQSRQQARYLAYSVIVLFVFTIAIGLANLLFTSSQVSRVRANTAGLAVANARLTKQIQADCGFYRDIAAFPVATPPMGGRPTIIVPKLISDSRAAWHGHGCQGQLPPPSPSYLKWAKFYHLPVG